MPVPPTSGYPGGVGTYIPAWDISGNLLVSYSRNPNSFAINKAVTIQPVKIPRGPYLAFNPMDQIRLQAPIDKGQNWPLGTPAGSGFENTLGLYVDTFECQRKRYNTDLEKVGVDVANWPIQKMHAEALAQQAMTYRTYKTWAVATDSTKYPSSHTVSATTANGSGFLNGGTTSDPRILNTLNYAARLIQQDTGGAIRWGQLSTVFNANTALKLSASREIREYVMQQPSAPALIRGDDKNMNAAYNLPDRLYSFNTTVEDTYYNDLNRGNASETGKPAFPDNTMLVFTRPGDLVRDNDMEMAPSYSTVHVFVYQDMLTETLDDVWNTVLRLRVTDYFDVKVVAPVSGVLVTNLFS